MINRIFGRWLRRRRAPAQPGLHIRASDKMSPLTARKLLALSITGIGR